jgi:hypothetical protein
VANEKGLPKLPPSLPGFTRKQGQQRGTLSPHGSSRQTVGYDHLEVNTHLAAAADLCPSRWVKRPTKVGPQQEYRLGVGHAGNLE